MTTLKTIHELTELAEVPATGDELVIYDASAGSTKRVSRSNFLGYTEYVALLTQSGTNAPTAVVVKNDTGATVTYGYSAAGLYTMTFGSAVLTANKTVAILVSDDGVYTFAARYASTTAINLSTFDSGIAVNSVLSSTPVIVRIYV
jgi:hypothetical protein